MKAFNVYLGKKLIDTVFYSGSIKIDKKEVYDSLVNHDGYDQNIKVTKRKTIKRSKTGIKQPEKLAKGGLTCNL